MFANTFVFLSAVALAAGSDLAATKMLINSVIDGYNTQSRLILKGCWHRDDQAKFLQETNKTVSFTSAAAPLDIAKAESNVWLIVDMNCAESASYLANAQPHLFSYSYNWLILNPVDMGRLNERPFLIDSNVLLAFEDANSNGYRIQQAHKRDKHQPMIHELVGIAQYPSSFIDRRAHRILSRLRRDLKGHLFQSSTAAQAGSIPYFNDYVHAHLDPHGRASYLVHMAMMDAINATMNLTIFQTYYGKDSNGVPFGMIADLMLNRIDIGGSSILLSVDRLAMVDYLSMPFPTSAAFVFRLPPLSYTANIYYLPFSLGVWLSSIGLVCLTTILTYIIYRCSTDPNASILDFILVGVRAACQMDTCISFERISGRIMILFFSIGMLFIFTSYTACIVALLQSTSSNINTLKDMLDSGLELALHNTTYERHWFPIQSRNDTVRTEIHDKIASKNAYLNFNDGVESVRKGMFAFHLEKTIAYDRIEETFHESEKCGLKEIDYMNLLHPWTPVPKGSPYKEIFKINLFKVREHGIQDRITRRFFRHRPICSSHGQNYESVRWIDCYAAFQIFLIGISLSLIILLAENIVHRSNLRLNCRMFNKE